MTETTRYLGVGCHSVPAATYHADPCPLPSLSSSVARILLAESAWHAWHAHPRLNPAYEPEEREAFDLGTAAHAYILQGEADFAVIDAADWKTKAAKESRDVARAARKTPLLVEQWAAVQEMGAALKAQLDRYDEPPRPFTDGRPEETLVWQERGVWCRARLDWLHQDARHIDDLKTTRATASPDTWGRSLWSAGYDVQAAFYLRGARAVLGAEAAFRFVVVESTPPYAMSVVALDPEGLALANRKVDYALSLWRECLETGRWPGYPAATCYMAPPPWELARWGESEYVGALRVVDDGRDIAEQLFGDRS